MPQVRNPQSAIRNPIDAFLLAKLESANLSPSPEADRFTLIRRLSLDLRGLPPSIEEVDAFINDASPNAYEKLVDRLLASPHYGEKLASMWLDLARFGDTNGFHYDSTRQMWLWRDYVINSFNSNKPYNQFTIEQLAGDLIPQPTNEQKIASGFNRCTRFNEEGGADPKEFSVRYAVDRVNTLGTVWLGVTLECAECHSHKYDPITQKEYYQLFAFFNSLEEPQVSGNHNQTLPPLLKIATPEQEKTLAEAKVKITDLEKQITEALAKVEYIDPLLSASAEPVNRRDFVWVKDAPPAGATVTGDLKWSDAPENRKAFRQEGKGLIQAFFINASQRLRIEPDDRLFVEVYLDPQNPPKTIQIQFNAGEGKDDWEHRAYWGADEAFGKGAPSAANHRHMGPLPELGKWVRLEVKADDLGLPGLVVHGGAFTQFDGLAHFATLGLSTATPQQPQDIAWIDDETPKGAKLSSNTTPAWQWVSAPDHPVFSGQSSLRGGGAGFKQHFFESAPTPLTIHAGDTLFEYVYLDPKNPAKTIALQLNVNGSWEHRALWGEKVAMWGDKNTPANRHLGPIPGQPGQWIRLEVDAARVGLPPGTKVSGWAFTQFDGDVYYDKAGVNTWYIPDERPLKSQSAWERIARSKDDKDLPKDVKDALKADPAKRTEAQSKTIRNHYLRTVHSGTRDTIGALDAQIKSTQDLIKKTEEAIPYTLISQEMKERRKAHILIRGNFETPGEEVHPNTPVIFPPLRLPTTLPSATASNLKSEISNPPSTTNQQLTTNNSFTPSRLDLANWLVSRDHPLTARVMVNRLWKQVFGTGLVKTMGDFGLQGERPSHPELLDYLAVEFMDRGWDVKHMIRLMVTSSAYRQSARFNPSAAQIDAADRLLWRAPRFRLSAEEVRDNALAIAGLLTPRIGGPSVNPYQPAGYYNGKFSWTWSQSKGDDLYRRGMYTFWRRTSLYPTFQMFDAPSREVCTADRSRTNTPLQALATMNDPTFVEASRVFAQHILTKGGPDDTAKLTHAFRRTLARPPTAEELQILSQTLSRQREKYSKDKAKAEALLSTGEYPRDKALDASEHAAWTAVANVLLNLDETIMRE